MSFFSHRRRRLPMRPPPPTFIRLNQGWNAEPVCPAPEFWTQDGTLHMRLILNHYAFPAFQKDDQGILRFGNCSRYRLGETNDEGWYQNQCRYRQAAPDWGEFYELTGPDPLRDQPDDWITLTPDADAMRHFLFYMKDETFECMASDWSFAPMADNALHRVLGAQGG